MMAAEDIFLVSELVSMDYIFHSSFSWFLAWWVTFNEHLDIFGIILRLWLLFKLWLHLILSSRRRAWGASYLLGGSGSPFPASATLTPEGRRRRRSHWEIRSPLTCAHTTLAGASPSGPLRTLRRPRHPVGRKPQLPAGASVYCGVWLDSCSYHRKVFCLAWKTERFLGPLAAQRRLLLWLFLSTLVGIPGGQLL